MTISRPKTMLDFMKISGLRAGSIIFECSRICNIQYIKIYDFN